MPINENSLEKNNAKTENSTIAILILYSLANGGQQKIHLMFHNADGSIELQVVLCHFRYLKFHSNVIQVMIQNSIIDGPIVADCRCTTVF